MPASTVMVRLTKSASITRFMREVPMTMESAEGSAPPHSDVPAPRGTTFSWF